MSAPRSIASLAWGAGTLVLLLGGSCQGPEGEMPDAGDGQPPPDLATSMPSPADAAVGQHPLPDMARPAPDMARPPPRDVTFYVVADTHNDPAPEPQAFDERATARAINSVAHNGQWPTSIGGTATGFVGGKIAPPVGVVFVGDLTGWDTAPTEIPEFRHYYEKGNSSESINYPAYLGLGNHDVDTADRTDAVADAYRAQYWAWIDSRHKGANAPVPVGNFDAASHAYSWDIGGVHFVQVHRFAGDSQYGLPSSLGFLRADLASRAADGRPVFLFHHYGMDSFGTNGQWWSDADRNAYRDALRGFNVSGIITGHTHFAEDMYIWQGLRVFQVNNAKAEINKGNNDGNGSFAIVRITDSKLDVVTCRWLDDQGNYELIAPWYSGNANPGPALRGPGPRLKGATESSPH
jgi:cytolysin (calcineurin-like family phosphatase)